MAIVSNLTGINASQATILRVQYTWKASGEEYNLESTHIYRYTCTCIYAGRKCIYIFMCVGLFIIYGQWAIFCIINYCHGKAPVSTCAWILNWQDMWRSFRPADDREAGHVFNAMTWREFGNAGWEDYRRHGGDLLCDRTSPTGERSGKGAMIAVWLSFDVSLTRSCKPYQFWKMFCLFCLPFKVNRF